MRLKSGENMDELKELFSKLGSLPAPSGFMELYDDLDIDVFQYTADIAGYVSSYLAGSKVSSASIYINDDLEKRFDACLVKLNELREFKRKHDKLAMLLFEKLSQDETK
jgi:hypothetical protein